MDSGANEEMLATMLTPGQWDLKSTSFPATRRQQTFLDDYNNQVLSP